MVEIVWEARDKSVADLIDACAMKKITYDTLMQEFIKRGWSTRYVYEALRNRESELGL